MSGRPTTTTSSSSNTAILPGAKALQEKLHELLTRLAATIELVKNWPESEGDDASIHVETTTKLIAAIKAVATTVQKVDHTVKNDAALKTNLQECLVPLDLLDLLDHGNGLNPDCFSRALVKEALGQLAGLKRRKLALEMLGAAVQSGLNKRDAEAAKEEEGNKRKRSERDGGSKVKVEEEASDAVTEPPAKKKKGNQS